MNTQFVQCNEAGIDDWLDTDVTPTDRQLAHVERCTACQVRLAGGAADDSFWRRASTVLQEQCAAFMQNPDDADGPNVEGPSPRWTDAMARQLLRPPSHPEMLGRIGRYEVERLIGAGGMGIVFKAFDTELNRTVAIKLLAPHLAQSQSARRRFSLEAQAAAGIVDEHVVPIHNVESLTEFPYLVMQYVAGGSLQDRLNKTTGFEIEEVLRIGMQTARGLAAAHNQGLIHRDVKPANVLLDENASRALLSDFGLARMADAARFTRSGLLVGTPEYMSPEQVKGDTLGKQSDLFSLGAMLYALCTGAPPFRGTNSLATLRMITDDHPIPLNLARPDVPKWLDLLIHRLLNKVPEIRIQSAGKVAELLEECLAHVRNPSTCPLPLELKTPTVDPRRTGIRPWLLTLAVPFALLLAIGMRGSSDPQQGISVGSLIAEEKVRQVAQSPVTEDSLAVVLLMHPGELKKGNGIQREVTESVINQLRKGDAFGHLTYSMRGPTWLRGDDRQLEVIDADNVREQVAAARSSLTGDFPELDTALRMCLTALDEVDHRTKRILLLTDGDPLLRDPKILDEFSRSRISIDVFHVEIHDSEYRATPLKIANGTGGRYFRIKKESAEIAVPKLFQRRVAGLLNSGVLTQPTRRTSLKTIARGFHSFHTMHGKFPGSRNVDEGSDGITGQETHPFSWRIAILPFIGHQKLYDQYRFDEPWDSNANRQLLSKIPSVYSSAAFADQIGLTRIMGFATVEGALGIGHGEKMASFTDGLSRTILVIENGESVPWTQPVDLIHPVFNSQFKGDSFFVFADGTVDRLVVGNTSRLSEMISKNDQSKMRARDASLR